MKYSFYIESDYKDGEESDYVCDASPEWVELHVRDFCKHLYHERDGWEWMKDTSERVVIVGEDESVRYFSFELEYEPTFFTLEVKQ